ncbi:hypothetical protein ACN47E_006008 [Coniothyrium glycines]
MADMASRVAALRSLLPDLESALGSFTCSSSKFRVVRTINDTQTQPQARSLYILDSSFNPPSVAHFTLVTSALRQHARAEKRPCRVLLLFSTHNADKAPSPAGFVQRLALMTMFAQDLSQSLHSTTRAGDEELLKVPVDIGLIKEPYYNDKSAAIADASPPVYPSRPNHIHLVGYDTLIRFCNPKYYPHSEPPLSALKPFFQAQHRLRVTQRPAHADDASSREFGSIEEQAQYVKDLGNGQRKDQGFEPAWADNIDMAPADEGAGISSTRVRAAAKDGRWDEVRALCTDGVAAWIQDQALYGDDG